MSKTTNIFLGNQISGHMEQQVSSGCHGNSSKGLRLLEETEANHKALQKAITVGFESGVVQDFDMDAIQRELDADC